MERRMLLQFRGLSCLVEAAVGFDRYLKSIGTPCFQDESVW